MPKIVVRHSELADFRQCPLKHRLKWIDGWEGEGASPASRLGTAIHYVLAQRYRRIRDQQKRFGYGDWARFIREGSDYPDRMEMLAQIYEATWEATEAAIHDQNLDEEAAETLRWMVQGYVEQHGVDVDWQVLAVETNLVVPFIEPTGKTSTRYDFSYHVDLAVLDHSLGGRVCIVDHKSTKRVLGQDDVDLMDQFGMYVWAWWRRTGQHAVPICNQIRTEMLKRAMALPERYERTRSFRTLTEMQNIAADALRTVKAAYSKSNREAPYSAPDARQCGWKCDFKEVHLAIRKDPRGIDAAPSVLTARGFHVEKEKSY